jgi:hypothetical protein
MYRNGAAGENNGPHATPAIAGNRILTIGSSGRLHGLDSNTGKVLWPCETCCSGVPN